MKIASKLKRRLAVFLCTGMMAGSGVFAASPPGSSAGEAAGSGEQAVRRFGLFIGSNNGGRDRIMLRYAVSDARAVSRVFGDMGGITGGDNILLVEPDLREINRQLAELAALLGEAKGHYKRTELVFYYSGHSDEEGLLLGRERYRYADLRKTINQIPSDMKIVILDSCSSGSFTRAKGGVKARPFLIDGSISAEGYAFLTSSSAAEASQESDAIESSYFTHSLVAGLRGAADTVGDRRVTLNEVYHFAYAETLAKTETSAYGAQHPSYDIQISGTGDVVLTDIRETSASLLIDEHIMGRLSIRDSSGYLIAEITKISQKPMELGLEPGLYRITLQRGDNFYRAEVFLAEDRRTPVTQDDFRLIAAATGTARGESPGGDDEDVNSLNLQLIPGLNILGGQKATDYALLGLFAASGHNLRGFGVAYVGLSNSGYVRGVQISGVYNLAGTDLTGFQAAGIFNTAGGSMDGFQAAGIFNTAQGGVFGFQTGLVNITGKRTGENGRFKKGIKFPATVQVGLVNISREEDAISLGLVNIVKNGIFHPAVYYDSLNFMNFSLRSGAKYFYSILSVGTPRITTTENLFVSRLGFGFELPLGNFFLCLDLSGGTVTDFGIWAEADRPAWPGSDGDNASGEAWKQYDREMDELDGAGASSLVELRLSAGYKIFEHFGAFAGVSYTYISRRSDTSPNPDSAWLGQSWGAGKDIHKIGVFAGLQF
jgi:hypothetical protein